MEQVLELYKQPYDPNRPLICMDELSKQLIGHTRKPLGLKPGQPARFDHEYKRNGVANLFALIEPLTGQCHLKVTERRTKIDWAHLIKDLVDVHYPQAQSIVLVMDNLNTHAKASLYEAFEPKEAKRIADRLEIYYTPKHGSWLNMAEIQLSVLSRQCLNRRIPTMQGLRSEIRAWQSKRNHQPAPIKWRFETKDARIKLKKLYPTVLS